MHLVRIIDGLYTRGHLGKSASVNDLVDAGINRVFCLTPQGEPALVGWKGYFNYPFGDNSRVDTLLVEEIARNVADSVHLGFKTLVMCRAGRNRTGLIVCLTLNILTGVSGEKALEMFRARRPRGVANPTFEEYLLTVPMRKPLIVVP